MNQTEIGKFIAKCRKEKKLTQAQLAEKLNITDRAVSKWETGKSMPDSSIMLELCEILGITVNELLSGEEFNMDDIFPRHYFREKRNYYKFNIVKRFYYSLFILAEQYNKRKSSIFSWCRDSAAFNRTLMAYSWSF